MRVSIEDHKGDPHLYEATVLPAAPGLLCVDYCREDTGEVHRVLGNGRDVWRCSCNDYRFRRAKTGEVCKHCLDAKERFTVSAIQAPAKLAPNGGNPQPLVPAGRPASPAPAPMREISPAPRPPEPEGVRPTGNLAAALSAACDRCRAAVKDARNEYHKYDYASAEEILTVADEALQGTGLAVIPLRAKLTVVGSGNVAIHALDRDLLLSHASGESVPLRVEGWPVVTDKGRPLDKAFASALTTSLAYLLRDLLRIPRVDPADDIAARDDTQHQPAKAPAAPPKPDPNAPIGEAKGKELAKLLTATGTPEAEVLERFHVDALAKLPAEHLGNVTASLQAKAKLQAQLKAMIQERGFEWAAVNAEIASRYEGKAKLTDLTIPQLRQMIGILEALAAGPGEPGIEPEEVGA